MSDQSENSSDSRETRPLWIIAVSLAAIAICLILITIRIQLDRLKAVAVNGAEPVPVEVSIHKPDRPPVQRRNFERPKPEMAALETTPPAPPVTTPEIKTGATLSEPLPPYGGGFAAEVRLLPGTNSTATIVGRVTLRGTPPLETVADESVRPPCLDLSSNAPVNPAFKVSNDGGLSEAIVAIAAGLEDGHFARPNTNHQWTFTNCQIYPIISAVRIGQRVSLVGGTDAPHLIQFAGMRSPIRLGSGGLPISSLPKFSGSTNDLVQLKCLQHPWEMAYFAQFDHSFFAVTDTNGNFAIPRVPAGTYTLKAVHRGLTQTNEIKQVVSVREHEMAVVNFAIDAPEMKRLRQDLSAQR